MLLRRANCFTLGRQDSSAVLGGGGEGRDLWRSAASPLTLVGVNTRLLQLWAQLQLLNQ